MKEKLTKPATERPLYKPMKSTRAGKKTANDKNSANYWSRKVNW